MNNFISLNIRYLCDVQNLTQKEFGEIFKLKQNVISSYIKENATPKIETMQAICKHFNISLDDFINNDLRNLKKVEPGHYYNDPLIGQMAQEPPGSFESAGYAKYVNELRGRLEDKEEVISEKNKRIKMLEDEIKRLKGGDNTVNNKTA